MVGLAKVVFSLMHDDSSADDTSASEERDDIVRVGC